ncbi:MAG TPA: nicotinate-nucleotide adenylyltransferase, partial [Pyrinomonadaceae bacterium]|nr:nicotinate-nucleotide adenylyltransferase [Pyrinomonadaceae bacterium]
YGGTFDPVHNGHLKVARGVQKLFGLDEVILMPAYVPPHKRGAGITSAFHRFAMLALATEHDEGLTISTAELDQPDRPYAVDTVAYMQETLGSDCRLFFVMGADSWSEITTWREWRRLLTMCDHLVVTRPGYELPTDDVRGKVVDVRGKNNVAIQAIVEASQSPQVFVTDTVFEDVSATAIRAAAKNGQAELTNMVPREVAHYIEKYELYRN